jgi:hypothetical protein
MEPLTHTPNSTNLEWNESYYLCFADPVTNIKGMSRIGIKPNKNEGMAFLFLFLPDGTAAGYQTTVSLSEYSNPFTVEDIVHENISDNKWKYTFDGSMIIVDDPKCFPEVRNKPELIISDIYEYSEFMTKESIELGKKSADAHWEQIALISGEISVADQKFALSDIMGQRDHTHGIREWTGIGNWLYYVVWFNRNLAINPAAIIAEDGRVSIGGFMFKDGVNVPLKSIKIVEQTFENNGIFPKSSILKIVDWNDEAHILKGTVGSLLPIPFLDPEGKKSVLIQAFGDYELDGITGGYGTFETLRKAI